MIDDKTIYLISKLFCQELFCLMLLFFIRWVVSSRWAFFKNLFGCGSATLCLILADHHGKTTPSVFVDAVGVKFLLISKASSPGP